MATSNMMHASNSGSAPVSDVLLLLVSDHPIAYLVCVLKLHDVHTFLQA